MFWLVFLGDFEALVCLSDTHKETETHLEWVLEFPLRMHILGLAFCEPVFLRRDLENEHTHLLQVFLWEIIYIYI